MIAAAGLQGFSQLVSGAGRLSPLRYIVWVLCVRAWTVRISVDFVGLVSFVFHWWWIDCSFLRLRNVLQWSIVGICADRDWGVSLGG